MMYRGKPGTGTPFIDFDELPATGPILGYSPEFRANPYTYARNDPINRVDPSGLDSTVITIDGTSYSISDSDRHSPTEEKVNRFITAKGIAEDAKAVFLALALEGAVYRHGMAAAAAVVKEMRNKANEGSLFSTVDLDYVKRFGSKTLTANDVAEWAAAEQMLAQFYEALNGTSELFDQLGFDKLELDGRTYFGGFEGGHHTGKGLDTAIDIVEAALPNPLDYDRGVEPTNVEVDIALAIFGKIPIPGVGSAAGMAGRAAAGAFRLAVPRAIRAVAARVLEYAIAKGNSFVLKPAVETTRYLLERMGAAGLRGLNWLEAKAFGRTKSAVQIADSEIAKILSATNDALLGVVDKNGTVTFFKAGPPGSGLPSGHADLVRSGLVPEGAQGFSIGVRNGQATTLLRNSILNKKAANFNLSSQFTDGIVAKIPKSSNFTVSGN